MKLNRTILLLAVVLSLAGIRSLAADEPAEPTPPQQQRPETAQTGEYSLDGYEELGYGYDDLYEPYGSGGYGRVVVQQLPKGRFLSDDDLKKLSPEARKEIEALIKERPDGSAPAAETQHGTELIQLDRQKVETAESAQLPKAYRYMIGVRVTKPDADADASEPPAGVIVNEVVEDSPAQKAGLTVKDLIVKVGDESIETVEALMNAVEASQGKKLELVLRRGDDTKTIEVKPIERPQEYMLDYSKSLTGPGDPAVGTPDVNRLLDWMAVQPGEASPNANFRFHAVHPGFVVDPLNSNQSSSHFFNPNHSSNQFFLIPTSVWRPQQPLPENLTVRIEKSGKQPATITVTRNDQTWTVTDKTLDRLPEDVRAHVQSLLGPSFGKWELEWKRRPEAFWILKGGTLVPGHPATPESESQTERPDPLDEQLKQLQKQLQQQTQQLQKLIEQIESSRKDEKNDE